MGGRPDRRLAAAVRLRRTLDDAGCRGRCEGRDGAMSAGRSGSGAVSRHSKNKCPAAADRPDTPESERRGITDEIGRADLPTGTDSRPISVEPGRSIRDELVQELTTGVQTVDWYTAVTFWRQWYDGYLNKHIEFESDDGELVRTELENSYMPEYGDRYYAKLKGVEREIERVMENPTTVMLTNTASVLNANGNPRCPVDHMREIADGFDAQRKALHRVLSDYDWEYCKIWEPHPGGDRGAKGYGHMHVGIFVDDPDDEIEAELFEKPMRSYYDNCDPAGWEAHTPDEAVSVSKDLDNMASYLSEYIGVYGDDPLDEPIHQQMFYATTWASNTRKVEFSRGAQELMDRDQFRRETGLVPEQRGGAGETIQRWKTESDGDSGDSEGTGWEVKSVVEASPAGPDHHSGDSGGVTMTEIDGDPQADPPPLL